MNCSKDKGAYTGQLQDRREISGSQNKEEISSVQEPGTKKAEENLQKKEISSEPEKID